MFNAKKATDMVIRLLQKEEGVDSHSVLKLMKLMYLAERKSIIELGHPICGDRLFALPHGPVLSTTLDLMKNTTGGSKIWDDKIVRKHQSLYLLDHNEQGYGTLSLAEKEILDDIWNQFKFDNAWTVRNWTHDEKNCPEWEDTDGSSRGISLQEMLLKNGVPPEDMDAILEEIASRDEIEELFSEL